MNRGKRDEIYQQYTQHIEAFDQDYRILLAEMEATDKEKSYYEEQFRIQSQYLWRAVDLVKEYHALLANMPINLREDDSMTLLWIEKRDQLQGQASVLLTELTGGKDAH